MSQFQLNLKIKLGFHISDFYLIRTTGRMTNNLNKKSKSPSDIVGAIQPKVSPFDQAVFKVVYLAA